MECRVSPAQMDRLPRSTEDPSANFKTIQLDLNQKFDKALWELYVSHHRAVRGSYQR